MGQKNKHKKHENNEESAGISVFSKEVGATPDDSLRAWQLWQKCSLLFFPLLLFDTYSKMTFPNRRFYRMK